jgi:hypothetical protein
VKSLSARTASAICCAAALSPFWASSATSRNEPFGAGAEALGDQVVGLARRRAGRIDARVAGAQAQLGRGQRQADEHRQRDR